MRIIKNTFKILFIFLVLILLTLPYAVKYGAIHYLEAGKNLKANIDDVSINFFTGRVGLQGVHLYGELVADQKDELHLGLLSIDFDMIELFSKNILIESLDFHDFKTNIIQNKLTWSIGGLHIPVDDGIEAEKISETSQKETTKMDWGFGVRSVVLSNIQINLSSQYTDSQFILNKLNINDLLSWYPDNLASLDLDLIVNGKAFQLNGDMTPFSSEPVFKTKIIADNVQLAPFLKSVKDLPFDEVSMVFFSDFDLEFGVKNKQPRLIVNGSYGLRDLRLKNQDRYIRIDTLLWDGSQVFKLPEAGVKSIDIDGLLTAEEINVLDFPEDIRLKQKKIELAGKYAIQLGENDEPPTIKANASLMLDDLGIYNIEGKLKLLSLDNLALKKIEVHRLDDISVKSIELNNLVLLKDLNLPKTPALVEVRDLIVENVHYESNKAEIDRVGLHGLVIDISLNKQKEIPVLALVSSRKNNEELIVSDDIEIVSEKSERPKNNKPLGFMLKELKIMPDSHVHFVDYSVTPIYDAQVHDLNLQVKNINSIESKQYANIVFDAKINEFAKFEVKGKVRPFSKKTNAKLKAKMVSLELVPLSSYTSRHAGINIKRGTLDFDANVNIKNNILDVKNMLYISRLNVESNKNEVSDNVFKDMPMPLDITLDVLRDKNDVIKLDIPVKGNINQPDFSLQAIYNKAMVKTMKFAATYYLTQAVQPLGLIVSAGKLVGKAMKPKFDPLGFKVGSSKLSRVNKAHIKKLAKILKDKDKLKFTICGAATESDWQVMQSREKRSSGRSGEKGRTQVLLKLANDRAKVVKKYFVDNFKISSKRLFVCNGRILKDNADESAFPQVEISL